MRIKRPARANEALVWPQSGYIRMGYANAVNGQKDGDLARQRLTHMQGYALENNGFHGPNIKAQMLEKIDVFSHETPLRHDDEDAADIEHADETSM